MLITQDQGKKCKKSQYLFELALKNKFLTDINKIGKNGQNLLHVSCKMGDVSGVEFLLKNREIDVDLKTNDVDGKTALHVACEMDHLEIAQLLVRANANVDEVDNEGRTPLHTACANGYKDIVVLLVSKADLNKKDKEGKTPLHLAVFNGHQGVVEILIKLPSLQLIEDDKGNTALHTAVSTSNRSYRNIILLCKRWKESTDRVNKNGDTPLTVACKMGYLFVVRHLLSYHTGGVENLEKPLKVAQQYSEIASGIKAAIDRETNKGLSLLKMFDITN